MDISQNSYNASAPPPDHYIQVSYSRAGYRFGVRMGRFQTTGALLNPYTTITPLPSNATNRGYAGIVAENDMFTLFSNSTGNYSQFDKLSNGIVATNSILNISNTWFKNMQLETEYIPLIVR